MGLLDRFFGAGTDFQALHAGGAQIVDVRTPGEFQTGHLAGSVNIPLDQLPAMLDSLNKERAVIVVCASGMRSAIAKSQLIDAGFEAYNGGSWTSLQRKLGLATARYAG